MRVQADFNRGSMAPVMEIGVTLNPSDIAVLARALGNDSPNDADTAQANSDLYDEFRRLQRELKILNAAE